MKKIWNKNGRTRPKGRVPEDDLTLNSIDSDQNSSVHIRSLVQHDYDETPLKSTWVNAVLNSLSRDFSEALLKLYRLELRGSHLYFYRPPSLLDVRLFKLDLVSDLARLDSTASSRLGKQSMDRSTNGTLINTNTLLSQNGNTSMVSSVSLTDLKAHTRSFGASAVSPVGGASDLSTLLKDDKITYFSPELPHPGLKFDFSQKMFLSSSSPEGLAHFYLFAEEDTMEAPLQTLLCVMPMLSDFLRILQFLYLYASAIYGGKYGSLTSSLEPTARILRLFGHINTHFCGFFLKSSTAHQLLKFFDIFDGNVSAEFANEISQFKSNMLKSQEQLLTLVNTPASAPLGNEELPFAELNASVFLNDLGLFDIAEAVTKIDRDFFATWNSSIDKSQLLISSIVGNSPGDTFYKQTPLIFNNSTHVHYLARLLVHHIFLETSADNPELRARLLEKWIDLGCLLDKMGDMSSWLGISSIILLQPVLRLASVWRYVSTDYITLIRKDWALILFELDRRHLASPFESVSFGSNSNSEMQTTFKDSFHIMAPRGLGKIYPKRNMIPYFGDLLVNNVLPTELHELESIWKKIHYSFERWNEYLISLQDSYDLITYNENVLRHYDSSGFILSNQNLNQVLCLGSKKDLVDNIPKTLTNSQSSSGTKNISQIDVLAKLYRIINFNCDSINLDTIMGYSLAIETSPSENYICKHEISNRMSRMHSSYSLLSDIHSLSFESIEGDNSSIYSSRLSGTRTEDKLPTFQSNNFKVDFSRYESVSTEDPESEIEIDKDLTLQRASFSFDLEQTSIDELGKMCDTFSDYAFNEGLGIDVENILDDEKFKNFSLEDFADAKDEIWTASDTAYKHSSVNNTLNRIASVISNPSNQYFPKFASVNRLIDLLIVDPKYLFSNNFVNLSEYKIAFMFNYSSFISTKELLQRLAHRFVNSGNAVISVMKKQYLLRKNRFNAATFGPIPNWDIDMDVNLTLLGKVDYELLIEIQSNILKVLIVLVDNFFGNFLNDLANKRFMIKLLKLYSNEILQWYNSTKIESNLDKSFESLVAYYKKLKKKFIIKTYRPAVSPKIDEILLSSYKFGETLSEVPVNRNLPSHKNIQKIEKFLIKFNDLLGAYYKEITPLHWFSVFKAFEYLYETNSLLNYKTQPYSVSEDVLCISNAYDYLFSVYEVSQEKPLFFKLPIILQTLLRLFSKFKTYLLIQLCDPILTEEERLDRMRTVLIMAKICRLKMSQLDFALDGNERPIPSFIESTIVNAIYSPQSRVFSKLWVAASISLASELPELAATKKFDSLDALIPTEIAVNNLTTSHVPLLPCIGWVVENMLELNKCSSFHGSLINFNKRYILFKFIREIVVKDSGEYSEVCAESIEFEFLFLLDENVAHLAGTPLDGKDDYSNGLFEKVIKKQYAIIASEAHRQDMLLSKLANEPAVPGPKTLAKKVSNSSLRRQSFNLKASSSSKFRLGGFFTKPKAFSLGGGSDRISSVRELPDCTSLADPKQRPVLVIPLKDRKIFPVYLLPACFKIGTDNVNEVCFLQAPSEAEAQDWLLKLNYAKRHWFQSHTITSKNTHACTTFGIPLDLICARDGTSVPRVLTTIFSLIEMEGLNEVGIYRIGASISELNNLKMEIDRTGTITTTGCGINVHALTGCVKLFLRELPESLLTDDVINNLQPLKLSKGGLSNEEVQAYKTLLGKLPGINYDTLKVLIQHLNRVYLKQEFNKMGLSNLATVIGPALTEASTLDSLINNFGLMNNILEIMIENFQAIFN